MKGKMTRPEQKSETSTVGNKPWLHPLSTSDVWYLPKPGMRIEGNATPDCSRFDKLDFGFRFSDGSNALESRWTTFRTDLQASCEALIDSSTIKRPSQLVGFARTVFETMNYALEVGLKMGEPSRLMTLSDITVEHVSEYLKLHNLQSQGIDIKTLKTSFNRDLGFAENANTIIDQLDVPQHVKKIVFQQLKSPSLSLLQEFPNAADDDEEDKNEELNFSTITNKATQLRYLHMAKERQACPFKVGKHQIQDCVRAVEQAHPEKQQTPLMPAETAFWLISNAIEFHRDIAPTLIKYIEQLDQYFSEHIECRYRASTIKSRMDEFRQQTYNAVPMPQQLKGLNIKTYGQCGSSRDKYFNHSILRSHISTAELLGIYAITTSILIYTFAAPRIRSVKLLDRNCLTLSKMDGLWDIKFKIPKASDSNELEVIKRPIPKVVWDFIDTYIDFLDKRHTNTTSFWPSERNSGSEIGELTMRKILDQFSDWIESPLYSDQRWYPRPHQFRRFFAAFFFYLGNNTQLEPLRWMLGHIEPSITMYYADISSQSGWEADTLDFLTNFLKGKVGKEVVIDEALTADLEDCRSELILGDTALFDEHLRELAGFKNIKLKLINEQQVFIYAGKP